MATWAGLCLVQMSEMEIIGGGSPMTGTMIRLSQSVENGAPASSAVEKDRREKRSMVWRGEQK